jgi:protein SCO1/2
VALLAVVVGALAGCSASSGDGAENHGLVQISGVHDDTEYHGAEIVPPYRMPDVTLTADNGQPFNLVTDTAYPVTLVFYGYTHCPDVCPLVLSDLSSAFVHLPEDVQAKTQVLFITTDPARDDAEVLRGYLQRFNPDFLGLTGRLTTITTVAHDMGVAITGSKRLPSGGYDVGHGAQVIGFRGNESPVIWTQGTPVPDLVSDIEKLAGS